MDTIIVVIYVELHICMAVASILIHEQQYEFACYIFWGRLIQMSI